MKIKINFEVIALVIVFLSLNWMGYANLSDSKMVHDYPFGFRASDSLERAFFAESVVDTGNYRYLASYLNQGISNTVTWYFPLLSHIVANISILSGFSIFDSLYFMVFAMTNLAVFVIYLLIRKYSKNIALLSLPFMLYIYIGQFMVGSAAGIWGYSTGVVFLATFFLFVSYFEEKNIWILCSLMLIIIMYHRAMDALIAFCFFAAYFIYELMSKRIDRKFIRKVFLMGGTVVLVSGYYMLYFANIIKAIGGTGRPFIDFIKIPMEFYGSDLSNFGFLMIILISVGILLSLLSIKKYFFPALAGITVIAFNYITYLGGSLGISYHSRMFLMPIFAAFFAGYAVYFGISLLKNVNKNFKVNELGIFVLFIIIAGIIYGTLYQPYPAKEGLFNKYIWDGFKWIQSETPNDSNVLFLYGDSYTQTNMLQYIKRRPFFVYTDEVQKQVSSGKLERYQMIEPISSIFIYQKGPLNFEGLLNSQEGYDSSGQNIEHFRTFVLNRKQDICSFDYYVIDKYSNVPVAITNFNNVFKETALKNKWFAIAYDNPFLTILKNNKPGDDCLGSNE